MIYCGYSGVGKTTYCKKVDGIDLDSSNYFKRKGWEVGYCNDAVKKSADGKDVFISAHQEVIQYLTKNNIDFVLIIPDGNKNEWLSRLYFRYYQNQTDGNRNAIWDCAKNFDEDMAYYNTLNCKIIKVHALKIQTDLEEKLLKIVW